MCTNLFNYDFDMLGSFGIVVAEAWGALSLFLLFSFFTWSRIHWRLPLKPYSTLYEIAKLGEINSAKNKHLL